jgi:hypothetical protein
LKINAYVIPPLVGLVFNEPGNLLIGRSALEKRSYKFRDELPQGNTKPKENFNAEPILSPDLNEDENDCRRRYET